MKKKLPTTPNIAPMTISAGQVDAKTETKQETTPAEVIINESRKQENTKQEKSIDYSCLNESPKQENVNVQPQGVDLSDLPEKTKQLKTVTMRISKSAADVLKDLKEETGLPNEILTDALIRHWEDLSVKTKKVIVEDAKRIRAWRLIEGKRKSLETAQRNNAF